MHLHRLWLYRMPCLYLLLRSSAETMSVVREVRMECTGTTTVTKNGVEREVR